MTGAVNVPADSSWVLECTAGLSNKSIIVGRKIKESVTTLARWFPQGSQGSTVLCGFSSVSGDSLCRCPRDGLLAPFPVKTNLELDQLDGPPTPRNFPCGFYGSGRVSFLCGPLLAAPFGKPLMAFLPFGSVFHGHVHVESALRGRTHTEPKRKVTPSCG